MDLEVKNLTKTYGTQKAVDNISFDVKTGEIVGFLGPNGAGKTTTMKILTCYMAPTNGDVRINGYNIRQDIDEIKKHIGYLPENNPLYKELPVIDHLHFVAEIQGLTGSYMHERVREMIKVCGLNPEKHKKVGELSKGYQQRLGLAQAIIHDPEVLILDEPTTGLDPNQIVEIRELIKELGKEKTVILSTHILPEVEATCGRILIINDGRIVADGTSENLRDQQRGKEEVRIAIENGVPDEILTSLKKIKSVNQVNPLNGESGVYKIVANENITSRREIFKICSEKGWTLTEMTPVKSSLEDIFRDLTQN